ncbi:ribose utilization transcriptional repressor RbsR [Liquorilactobacillus nagelii]|uniref:ribose utilization transcriptional repressor RbsR n=1 Tax=Liquorilactobacillus nagelii TaxID=82688 RepID=UPI0006EE6408|nr:LacI family DNA-binding transcriptional regulator [Liquorilactobacillus nagelii]KRL41136.1 ribose operon repressor [Liquorilactobacillus nagelii DSM 13675]QYH54064.1 LacI family transcriptional regulator [Liquorilactobacillus nagelii DSM 13675]
MSKRTTIKDLSLATGVSITTISQILNGKGQRFSSETRNRVLKAKEKLNYIPNFNARNLILKNPGTIAILVPDISNSFFSTLIKGVQSIAIKNKFLPLIFNSSKNEDLERYYLNKAVERNINGIIIASSLINNTFIDNVLKKNKIPYLVLDQNATGEGDRIFIDDLQGGKIVADYLLSLDHRDFIVVLPKNPPRNVAARLDGFSKEINKFSSKKTSIKIFYSSLTKEGGYKAAARILKAKQKATAIFAINDEIAVGIYRMFHEKNINIPKKFSVIGYDDIEIDQYIFPNLTSVRQPAEKIGIEATKLLIKRINNPSKEKQFVKLPVELIIRESAQKIFRKKNHKI